MTEYRPFAEWLALFAALEAELLAAPAEELRQAAAARATPLPDAAERAIAAALDGTAPLPAIMPPDGSFHPPASKSH